MSKYKIVQFNKEMIEALPGYELHEVDSTGFYYGFRGQSALPNEILYSQDSFLYTIKPDGNLAEVIQLSEYPNDIMMHPEELRPNVYGGFLQSQTDPAESKYIVAQADLITGKAKIIEEYKVIGEVNGLMNYHICKYIGPGHVILLMDYKEPDVYASTYSLLQEQVDGKIVWEWDSRCLRDSNIKDYVLTLRSDGIEALHLNGLDVWDSKHLVISCRNLGICCLNKDTNKFDWIIGQKKNDLNFENLPLRQHDITFVDTNKFLTFNNNYPKTKYDTRDLLNMTEIDAEDYLLTENKCEVIMYDLNDQVSICFKTDMSCSPRSGNVWLSKNGILNINYGQCMELIGNTIYKFNLYQEIDMQNGNVLFNMILPDDRFAIHRGLLKE